MQVMLYIGDMRYVEMFLWVTLTFRLNIQVKPPPQKRYSVFQKGRIVSWNIMSICLIILWCICSRRMSVLMSNIN